MWVCDDAPDQTAWTGTCAVCARGQDAPPGQVAPAHAARCVRCVCCADAEDAAMFVVAIVHKSRGLRGGHPNPECV